MLCKFNCIELLCCIMRMNICKQYFVGLCFLLKKSKYNIAIVAIMCLILVEKNCKPNIR